MELSALTIKLIILITPGILSATIYKRLVVRHKEQSDFMFVIMSILFGVFSYSILQVIYFVYVAVYNLIAKYDIYNSSIGAVDFLSNSNNEIPFGNIVFSSLISIFIGYLAAKVDNEKWINKVAVKYKISYKYGDENLYTKYLSSQDLEWVYVRDIKNSITYFGWVKEFSETNDMKELVLGDVTVFTYPDSLEMYSVDSIYLSFSRENVIIEKANNIK